VGARGGVLKGRFDACRVLTYLPFQASWHSKSQERLLCMISMLAPADPALPSRKFVSAFALVTNVLRLLPLSIPIISLGMLRLLYSSGSMCGRSQLLS
jgi:hypothetical protein